jgi:hypothetical protein
MIDVSELITDPDFASTYVVIRRTGQWVKGRFVVGEPLTLNYYGAVQPATVRELQQLAIGDHESGVMKFFVRQPNDIYITRVLNKSEEIPGQTVCQISDEIEFRGLRYKVLQIMPWQNSAAGPTGGWTRAFASLK